MAFFVHNRKNFLLFDEQDEMKGIEVVSKKLGIFHTLRNQGEGMHLKILKTIVSSFSNLPYENLTKRFYAFQSPFDVAEVFINHGGGGTCFPLVYLLKRILDIAGFSSSVMLADRTYAPRSHCFLFLGLDEKRGESNLFDGGDGKHGDGHKFYLIDIGFSVFFPVEIVPGKSMFVRVPQGELVFDASEEGKIDVWSLFPNGHRKFRYSAKLSPVSPDDFMDAWGETYNFEMMNHAIVVKLVRDTLIYIKDNFVHFVKDGVSKNVKMDFNDILKILGEMGIDQELFLRAVSEIGLSSK